MNLDRYFERIFKYMDKRDKKKNPKNDKKSESKKYCSNFIKGEDGFCKYYLGCRVNISSCSGNCGKNGD